MFSKFSLFCFLNSVLFIFYWTEIQVNLQSFFKNCFLSSSIELIADSHHYCRNRLDLRLEGIGLRPVAVGWIAERIDCSAGGTGSTFAGTDLTVVAIGSIAEGIDSTFGDIDSTFAGTGSIVVATGWIAEGIDSIVVDIGSTFVGTD